MRNVIPPRLSASEGPFKYTYLGVIALPGAILPAGESLRPFHAFPGLGANAILSAHCNPYFFHLEQSTAIGSLMLTGFPGRSPAGWLSARLYGLAVYAVGLEGMFRRSLRREVEAIREQRRTEPKNPGCYLIYEAEGDLLEAPKLEFTRRVGAVGYGFDIFPAAEYRSLHRHAMYSAATSLALALTETNCSPEMCVIGDLVYMTGSNGLVVYSKTMELGAGTATVSSTIQQTTIDASTDLIPSMISDSAIRTSITLFVESQTPSYDNLHSFIAAWSALELLVNRLAKTTRPRWSAMLANGSLPAWDKDLTDVPFERYRMRDRFFLMASALDITVASIDAAAFCRINDLRGDFYHQVNVRERDLPTNDTRTLYRRYLKLSLCRLR